MHTSLTPSPSWSVWVARLAMALVVALMLGALVAPQVDAVKSKGKVTSSVGDRIQAQSDLCFVAGGSFTSTTNQFGTSVTACSGGAEGSWRCVNSKHNTYCDPTSTPPPPPPGDDDTAPPPSDVAPATGGGDSPTGGGGGTTDGSGSSTDGGTGGSGVTPPGIGAETPAISDGGRVTLTAYHGGKPTHATHHGRHGKRHKR